jgi:glycosyltransferase involved in cell wall biosynthesis
MKPSLSVMVLTRDEALHLERCLKSVEGLATERIVIDSGSADGTREIARRCGATVYEHPFENQAAQVNWAIDNVPMRGEWVLRLDADEYLLPELRAEIEEAIAGAESGIGGYLLKRRVYFMGRWIRHGGYYPTWILRLWRRGTARCEAREMDEHMAVTVGEVRRLSSDFVDENLHDLTWWTEKHNQYSSREVLVSSKDGDGSSLGRLGAEVYRRRRAKATYASLPLFSRAWCYFFYRYIIRFGFLDGTEGFIFHVLQGFWYRFLVDAKLYEWRKVHGNE